MGCGNLDDTFAYQTVKVVGIRDKRLGLLKLAFMIAIAIFILLYQLLYMNNYLKLEAPTGTVRFSLREPMVDGCRDMLKQNCSANYRAVTEIPYCGQNTACKDCKYMCEYLDSVSVQESQDKSLLITTYTEIMNQTKSSCGENATGSEKCSRVWDNGSENPSRSYVADIESFTLLIDHVFTTSSNFGLTKSARTMKGRLESSNYTLCKDDPDPRDPSDIDTKWSPSSHGPCLLTPQLVGDGTDLIYFTVGDLLRSQNLVLDDVWVVNQTQRRSGAIYLAEIEYSNTRHWTGVAPSFRNVWYSIRIKPVAESTYKSYQTIYGSDTSTRTVITKTGLRLSTVMIGDLGKFDMTTMLLQLTTSLSLIAVATVIVDALAMYVMKDKDVYRKSKYEMTESFGKEVFQYSKKKDDIYEGDTDGDEPLLSVNE
eukprot:m.6016 g.6016  ORF g.6016 m.6016 type:complete len:426 (-) comp3467_c0_seq1:78-1355(-)